ncbi:hypothetical protein ACFSR7_05870 [Cohnella sp. GCM10020058]|uniref:hypothetical protein n=1 Tax=Cohnella sp. GCM10020058 TaxID=3317330 RepID=UPI003635640F
MTTRFNLTGVVEEVKTIPHPDSPAGNLYLLIFQEDGPSEIHEGLPLPGRVKISVTLSQNMYSTMQAQYHEMGAAIEGSTVAFAGWISASLSWEHGGIVFIPSGVNSISYQMFKDPKPKIQEDKLLWPERRIIVPDEFLRNPPKQEKLQAAQNFISEHGQMEKPCEVELDADGQRVHLKDGYAKFLAAKRLGHKFIWVDGESLAPVKERLTKKNNNSNSILKSVSEDAREQQPDAGEEKIRRIMWPIELLEVPETFKVPRDEKIQAAIDYFNKHREMDKPIEVRPLGDGRMLLQDSYARYLASKKLGRERVWIIH